MVKYFSRHQILLGNTLNSLENFRERSRLKAYNFTIEFIIKLILKMLGTN